MIQQTQFTSILALRLNFHGSALQPSSQCLHILPFQLLSSSPRTQKWKSNGLMPIFQQVLIFIVLTDNDSRAEIEMVTNKWKKRAQLTHRSLWRLQTPFPMLRLQSLSAKALLLLDGERYLISSNHSRFINPVPLLPLKTKPRSELRYYALSIS